MGEVSDGVKGRRRENRFEDRKARAFHLSIRFASTLEIKRTGDSCTGGWLDGAKSGMPATLQVISSDIDLAPPSSVESVDRGTERQSLSAVAAGIFAG